MNTPTVFQRYQRMFISKVSHRPRRIALLTFGLMLVFIMMVQNLKPFVFSDPMGFMSNGIRDVLRTDPSSVHDRYLQAWRKRIIQPNGLPYNLSEPSKADFSRGQSRVVLTLTDKKTKGFFVDIGAGDGETNSVTLGLELQAEWEGLLVEGDPIKFKQLLSKHRRSSCLNARMSYGKLAGKPPSDLDLLPSDLLQAINRTHIDLLSINLRGQELDFLRSVNVHLHTVKIIIIELQADTSKDDYMKVTSALSRHGYRVSHHIVDGRAGKKDIVFARD